MNITPKVFGSRFRVQGSKVISDLFQYRKPGPLGQDYYFILGTLDTLDTLDTLAHFSHFFYSLTF